MKKNKLLAMFLAATLVCATLGGCGSSEEAANEAAETETEETVAESAEADEQAETVEAEDESTAAKKAAEESASEESAAKESAAAEETVAVEAQAQSQEASAAESNAAEAEADYTVNETAATTMYAKKSVNVRAGASTDYEKIGTLSWAEEVTVTGQASTGWYQISYNGGVGYVSDSYLVDTKPEQQVASNSGSTGSTGTTSSGTTRTETSRYTGPDGNLWIEYSDNTVEIYVGGDSTVASSGSSSTTTASNDGGNIEPTVCTDFVGYINSLKANLRAEGSTTVSDADVVWDDNMAATALERAQEISTDFSHNGSRNCNAEIIEYTSLSSSYDWYMNFYNSPAHYSTMVAYGGRIGAAYCEVNGIYYIVVVFKGY